MYILHVLRGASGTRTHVRVSVGTHGVCVRRRCVGVASALGRRNEEAPAWRGVGGGEEEKEEDDGRRNTSGEPLWKEDMMARGVMLRELLCSSGTTGP